VVSRLAENTDVSVLLLEAGGSDDMPSILEANQWPMNLGSEQKSISGVMIGIKLDRTSLALRRSTTGAWGAPLGRVFTMQTTGTNADRGKPYEIHQIREKSRKLSGHRKTPASFLNAYTLTRSGKLEA
jgi:hypothetical protein